MKELAEFRGYTIATSVEREKGGVYGIAVCPICGSSEESHDHGYGERHALIVSIGKIQTHMQMAHGIEDARGKPAES